MTGLNKFILQLQASIGKYCSAIILLLAVSSVGTAQQGQGKLAGKITDGSTNEPLAGVSITVKGKKGGVASITDGTYILSLSAGTYTIAISYQSYRKKELSGVEIKSGQTTFLDVILDKADNKLIDVVVTSSAKKESQSAVYSAQKRSSAASDGISKEAISKTPDNNAGQILKRVTGVNVQDNRFVVVRGLGDQYNQTTLNGVPMTSTETNKNAFAFDLIPAAVIEGITINKTATPDMPGNFAGGIVQINTKDFPTSNFFSVAVQGGFSDETIGKDFYNDKRGKLEGLTFSGGIRDLPKDFPSSTSIVPFTSLNLQEKFRLLRQLNNNLAPVNYGPSKPNENIQFGYGKTIKFKNETQFGIVAAINQRKTELIEQESQSRNPVFTTNLQGGDTLQGLRIVSNNTRYRYSADFGGVVNLAYKFGNNKIMFKNLYTRVLNNTYADRSYSVFANDVFTAIKKGITHFVEERSILNSGLSGEHRTGKNDETRIDWNFNLTANNIYNPDLRNFILQEQDTGKFSSFGSLSQINQSLIGASRLWSGNKDIIYSGAFNITTPFDLFKNKQLFKSGILFQNRVRKANGTILPVGGATAALGNLFAPDSYYPGGNGVNLTTIAVASGAGNYDGGSSLLAAYFSLENKIGKKTRVIWGMRAENYQQNVNVFTPVFYDGIAQPEHVVTAFAARTTFNFLPSINVVYSPVQSINFRAAYSNTVIRPDLKDIAEFQRFDLVTFALSNGNSKLKSSSISNYDFKFEWFPSAGEIISFSAFYKKILDPIEYAITDFGGSNIFTKFALNTGDTYVKGLEGEVRKKLNFIDKLPWLSHVTLFTNGSLLRSKVNSKVVNDIGIKTLYEHTLSGQARYIVNGGMSILLMKETLEATISYNKTGDYINELGAGDQDVKLVNGNKLSLIPPIYLQARDLVDVVISKSILKNKGKFKFNVTNFLKRRYLQYQDLNGNGKFDTPVVVMPDNGVLIIDNYQSGVDNVPLNIQPQRSYSLSFTYTF